MSRPIRVAVSSLGEGELVLDAAASRYLVRVHRLRAGAPVVLFDPVARIEADATLIAAAPAAARCRVGAPRPAACVAPLAVRLVQALGKVDKPDQVVRDATALGVRSIVLVHGARSVPRPGERGRARHERWQQIAVQAARQSGRGDLPELVGPTPLAEALDRLPEDGPRCVLDPRADAPLLERLAEWRAEDTITLLIGPEGGLTEQELGLATARGFRGASLGTLTLRTETAATAALGALLAFTEARRRASR